MITMLLLCVITIIIFCLYLHILWDIYKTKNLPGPFPLPLVGNGHLVLGNAEDFFIFVLKLNKTYKDIFRMYILNKKYVIIHNPKYIEAVVTNMNLINKGSSYKYLHPWLGQGLLTASGQQWKTNRRLLTPAFHYGILQKFFPIFEKNNKIFIDRLNKIADGRPIDVFPYIASLALDNITESIMGVSINAQKDHESEYVQAVASIVEIICKRMRNIFLMFDITFNLSSYKTRQDEALKVLHGLAHKVIEERREELERLNITQLSDAELGIKNKYAFLDLLLLSEVEGKKISTEHVREEVDTFMFEGHDTTTSGIAFSLYCIAKHKHIQDKIVNELKEILDDDIKTPITKDDLQKMKYLEMVIRESLRLYPSVPFFERTVTHDTEILDIKLKKNTNIIINVLGLQTRADIFDNPYEFRPERFDPSNTINAFDWLAFSAGPRNCIGQKFAMLEMKSVIAEVLRNFEVLPTPNNLRLTGDLVMRSVEGVLIKFLPR